MQNWHEDKIIAAYEKALWELGKETIRGIHLDVVRALGFEVKKEVVDKYKVFDDEFFAKAVEKDRKKAYQNSLKRFRNIWRTGKVKPKDIPNLSKMITEWWFSLKLLESKAMQKKLAAFLAGWLRQKLTFPKDLTKEEIKQGTISYEEAGKTFRLDDDIKNTLQWASLHMSEHVTNLGDKIRSDVNKSLYASLESQDSPQATANKLFNTFSTLNKDWRRIAITEANSAHSNGTLVSHIGKQARFSVSKDGCQFCQGWNQATFKIVTPSKKGKNPLTEIWAGKNNVGRSFYLKTKSGRERTLEELAIPTIPLHPNCRCRWVIEDVKIKGADPKFTKFLEDELANV